MTEKLNNYGRILLAAASNQKRDLIEEYLSPHGMSVDDLMDRNVYSSLCQLLDAHLLMAVRNSSLNYDIEQREVFKCCGEDYAKGIKICSEWCGEDMCLINDNPTP